MSDVINNIYKTKVYGVVRAKERDRAVEITKAMFDGWIKVVELNMHTEGDLYYTIDKASSIKGLDVVAGGIITAEQALYAIQAGAKVISSPIIQTNLVKLSKWYEIPLILTASTPNEAYTAWKYGVSLIKMFPIENLGGAKYVEDVLRPMPFLNLMPTGSVKLVQADQYIKAGARAVAVGREIYLNSTYKEIAEKSAKFLKYVGS